MRRQIHLWSIGFFLNPWKTECSPTMNNGTLLERELFAKPNKYVLGKKNISFLMLEVFVECINNSLRLTDTIFDSPATQNVRHGR